jgi:two-component system response regulator GlrR
VAASILIVDDDENVARGIQMALTLRGYHAVSCGSAEEALQRLHDAPWALVLSDLRLPDGDGQALLHQIAEAYPEVRRVLITGYGSAEIAAWASREADDYLVKPFSSQRLLQAVQRLVPQDDST